MLDCKFGYFHGILVVDVNWIDASRQVPCSSDVYITKTEWQNDMVEELSTTHARSHSRLWTSGCVADALVPTVAMVTALRYYRLGS